MKVLQVVAIMLVFALPPAASAQNAEPNPIVAMGAYVASDDLRRSETFYQALFESVPVIRLDDFVAFDVAGGWFAIVSRDRYAEGSVPGSGVVPYIQSDNLEALQARAADALGEPAPEILVEPGIRILKLEDPNGQLIEFFSLTGE